MSQNTPRRGGPDQPPAPLDAQTIREFIKIQQQQAHNEAKELEIKSKEVDNSYKFAMKSLELQAEYHKSRPGEARKSLKTFANYLIVSGVIFLVFCGFCIHYNQTEFLFKFLQGLAYIVTTIVGYFIGKKQSSKAGKNNDDNGDVEIIE